MKLAKVPDVVQTAKCLYVPGKPATKIIAAFVLRFFIAPLCWLAVLRVSNPEIVNPSSIRHKSFPAIARTDDSIYYL